MSRHTTLFTQRVDNHLKEIKILQKILGCSLGLRVLCDNFVEVQQFHRISIGECRSNHALFKGLAMGFVEKEQGGQMANVRSVILDADLFGLP